MPTSMIVVDDFLEDAENFRRAAMSLDYPDLEGAYPGRNSRQRLELSGLAQHVSALVGERLKPIDPLESHGKCRLALASDKRLGDIHVDSSQWSGILYLSKDEHARGGTDFFRHKKTNLDRCPINDADAARQGLPPASEVMQQTVVRDGSRRSAWEKISSVPMRFNRLLLLRPWLFHTSGPGFGSSVEDGRLIYVMFFTLDR